VQALLALDAQQRARIAECVMDPPMRPAVPNLTRLAAAEQIRGVLAWLRADRAPESVAPPAVALARAVRPADAAVVVDLSRRSVTVAVGDPAQPLDARRLVAFARDVALVLALSGHADRGFADGDAIRSAARFAAVNLPTAVDEAAPDRSPGAIDAATSAARDLARRCDASAG